MNSVRINYDFNIIDDITSHEESKNTTPSSGEKSDKSTEENHEIS